MKNTIYIASRSKSGGIYKFEDTKENGYVAKGFFPLDSPMYMIIKNERMHILLRSPFENKNSGYISCSINDKGDLLDFSKIISTKGEIACHLTEFKKKIYCVNYTSGDLTKIGEKTVNHNSSGLPISHPHYVGPTPDGKYIAVTDLGQDLIYIYDEDLNCVNKVNMPSGHGVRHLVFSEDGRYVFSANELESTVSALEYKDGDMLLIDTISCLPKTFGGESFASAIRLYENNIYVANRGHNSISKLHFDGAKLEFVDCFDCEGKTPRDFIIHGNKIVCANQDSNSVTVFEKASEGKYKFIQKIDMNEPICVICGKEE
ncbi:MAG: beta-propeller fold lactonase family protein [Clostridia bacterium]|nr:beta-propeller fold lactonase family protein [Clostridia bacterium]